ncbi:MAG TPA: gas vesicle protein GvpG [Lentisphaeria bacterium]|nr:MAG: gas vesicle protein GvpG [Lentisphaerae bacterium GWF2_38_69]HBM16050.1 gas vesicle protein GvpG [Lentisphaeria bacterium]
MFIIDDLLMAPLKGLTWIANKIDEVAQKEASDEGKVMDELMRLQLRFELDEIDEQEYNRLEGEIMDRLEAVRKEKEGQEIKDGKSGKERK